MAHAILERHRKGLRRFARVVGVMGWVLLIAAVLWLARSIVVWPGSRGIHSSMVVKGVYYAIMFITPGFFAIGLGQLIRFSLDNKRPGRFLRSSHVILFIIAGLNIVYATLNIILMLFHLESYPNVVVNMFIASICQIVYGVILVGLGVALHEMLPIVEESQTLA